ncbi:MAG: DUF501 domain-containing protein [Candidatus Nanopelagicales bacterium]
MSISDEEALALQIGRPARGVVEVAHRCKCGLPDVVKTLPKLPDGTPFPTMYYITCQKLASKIGTLEANGVMKELEKVLDSDPELKLAYAKAHASYLEERNLLEDVEEIQGISAGGMPTRVKCLHALIAHSLAVGPGVNPIGDKALALLQEWGNSPCVGEE